MAMAYSTAPRRSQVEALPPNASVEQIKTLLRSEMPFQLVPEETLEAIAQESRIADCQKGEVLYEVGDTADDIYIVLSGQVEHALAPDTKASELVKTIMPHGIFGFAALIKSMPYRIAKATCIEEGRVLCIPGAKLLQFLEIDRRSGDIVMSRMASIVSQDFSIRDWFPDKLPVSEEPSSLTLTLYRFKKWLRTPSPYLMLLGFVLFFGFWYFATEVWKLPRFRELPGPTEVIKEWFSPDPAYGLSFYTADYYTHILVSLRRIAEAFALACVIGIPLGLFMGYSKIFRDYAFPLFEILRPIPTLAWVPLALLMFKGQETPVIYLAFLAPFFATALNTMLGVQSIDETYIRAAACLGASRWQIFRHVIVPGALPYIFTGLQISIGVAWFSLVAAEMVSGQYGLGYVINTSYTTVRYPTIIIGMITLGAVGYATSALVGLVGDMLMQWKGRELAMGDRR